MSNKTTTAAAAITPREPMARPAKRLSLPAASAGAAGPLWVVSTGGSA